MAEVLQIRPKGIYVTIEYSLDELEKLRKAYEMCEIKANMKDPEEAETNRYFVEEHYPMISKICEDLKNGPRSDG